MMIKFSVKNIYSTYSLTPENSHVKLRLFLKCFRKIFHRVGITAELRNSNKSGVSVLSFLRKLEVSNDLHNFLH